MGSLRSFHGKGSKGSTGASRGKFSWKPSEFHNTFCRISVAGVTKFRDSRYVSMSSVYRVTLDASSKTRLAYTIFHWLSSTILTQRSKTLSESLAGSCRNPPTLTTATTLSIAPPIHLLPWATIANYIGYHQLQLITRKAHQQIITDFSTSFT